MRNPIGNLNSLKAQRDALNRRIEKLEKDSAVINGLAQRFIAEAKELGISKREIALAIDPDLDRGRGLKTSDIPEVTASTKRAPRKLKRYTNPHTQEEIDTKGGNHSGLKAWKEQYGASTVESWAKIIDSKAP